MAIYEPETPVKPTDLRGILKYVPEWRGKIFVIALDGGVVEDDNFSNLLLDVAVLRSLNIHVVLVAGIGQQLARLSQERNVKISDVRGEGPIDDLTLRLSIEASGIVTHEILQGLSATGQKCALTNAIRVTEMGILGGIPQQWRGRVDKVDLAFFRTLIDAGVIPVVPPIHYTRDGRTLRLNSDLLASELAMILQASKLIYLSLIPGLTIHGHYTLNIGLEEIRSILEKTPAAIEERVRSKVQHAIRTIDGGVPRVHIMDGRLGDGLLSELFSKVGVGSMIHGNEYEQIRAARRKDVAAIFAITQKAVKAEALRHRSKQSIEKDIDHFYVHEIDESVVGCIALFPYPEEVFEIASVYVQPFYQNKGVGRKLVEFAIDQAIRQGARKIFALSTQAYTFFKMICQFQDGSLADLPEERRQALAKSGRNSRILIKTMTR